MTFDPYSAWLDLPAGARPPDPYTLLGLRRFERDQQRIAAAAEERIRLLHRKAPFDRGDEMRLVLGEIASAKRLLADPARRRQLEVEQRAVEKRKSHAVSANEQRTHSPTTPASAKRVSPKAALAGHPRRSNPSWMRYAGAAGTIGLLCSVALLFWTGRSEDPEPHAVNSINADPNNGAPPPDGQEAAATASSGAANQTVTALSPSVEASRPPENDSSPPKPLVGLVPPPLEPALPQAFAPLPIAAVEARKPVIFTVAEYRLPSFESDADRDVYSGHIRGLLDEAFDPKGDATAAEEHLRQANALSPDHPFTKYAAALADWKRRRFPDAETHLRLALGVDADPFFPARRASIRLHLNRNRRTEALKEAVALATTMPSLSSGDQETRWPSIRWLGRLLAALESPWLPDVAPPKEVVDADAAIRATLGADLATYEAGRRSLHDDYTALAADVEAKVAGLSVALEDRRSETLEKIAEDRDAAQDEKEQVNRTAAEWKEWFDKETKGIDENLKKLETVHQQVSVQAEAAAATYLALSEQITLEQARDQLDDDLPSLGGVSAQLIVAANQAAAQLKLLNGQLAEIQRQARILLTRRQGIVTRFERETRTLTARNDSLRKWEGILKRRADATDAEEAADSPAAKSLRRRLRSLETYLPFDLDAEREAVLRALREAA